MFDFILLFKLLTKSFSFKKRSLRYPTGKRLLIVFFLLPLASLLLLVNWLFLLLDEVIFFRYRKLEVKRTVFIIGIPRSATTFMLELLASDRQNLTCFKLWELILAPSIIQKYFWSAVILIDRKIDRPLYKLSLRLDKILFDKMLKIHPLSLCKPEEDEYLFLYIFSSVTLYYLYPEVAALDSYKRFDRDVSEPRKKRTMAFYKRCVQRHNYVFNPQNNKYFLSKNPAYTPKIEALNKTFPSCRFIYMIRSPLQAIPATISMNNHVFRLYARVTDDCAVAAKTTELLLDWYEMAKAALDKISHDKKLIVPFNEFVTDPKAMLKEIYTLLNLSWNNDLEEMLNVRLNEIKNYKSEHIYNSFTGNNKELVMAAMNRLIPDKLISRM